MTDRPDRSHAQLPDHGGNTNGGPMRALPVGWATPPEATERRRRWTIGLTRVTHAGPEAQLAACVVATCAAWSLTDEPPARLLDVAVDEADAARRQLDGDTALPRLLRAVAADAWYPPTIGIGLDPAETVAAVLHCAQAAASLPDGLDRAIRLGGDTDTVAALVAGLLGAQHAAGEIASILPWSSRVRLPPAATVARLASGLAALRGGRARTPVDGPSGVRRRRDGAE